ncbi:hypothetical protein CR983_01570 [Candidatus Saccharibacteria bacterium]|nr:MAG: hypothetical protein CR983_01570 [Candidatus Saccharibacteria bacterium]
MVSIAVVLAAVVITAVCAYGDYIHKSSRVVTVCGVEKVAKTDDGKTITGNLVYTSDGVYTYNDYAWLGLGMRTSSLDGYGKIAVGEKYAIETYGWRNGVLNMAPNIISATPTDESPVGSC